jgi:hypothetical protein
MLFLLLLVLAVTHAAYTPIYGKYCGGGYTQANKAIPGIDAMDAACRIHDMCYQSTGYSMCACDRVLLAALRRSDLCNNAPDKTHCSLYRMGADALFSAMPCRCPVNILGHSFKLYRGIGGNC